MSDTDRNNLIAAKFRELADLFQGVAQGAGPSTDPEAPAAEEKKKPGRPKAAPAPPPVETPPVEDDKTVTDDHPKRAELKTVAKEYASKTDLATAQKAMKLFGESSKLVPDCDLVGAIKYFRNLLAKLAEADV